MANAFALFRTDLLACPKMPLPEALATCTIPLATSVRTLSPTAGADCAVASEVRISTAKKNKKIPNIRGILPLGGYFFFVWAVVRKLAIITKARE
jgi:hypothetical protein